MLNTQSRKGLCLAIKNFQPWNEAGVAEAPYSSESLTGIGLYGSSEKAHDLSPWAGGSKESSPMGGVEGSIVM